MSLNCFAPLRCCAAGLWLRLGLRRCAAAPVGRNLAEPLPATCTWPCTGTFRNLGNCPEPSGTCAGNLHPPLQPNLPKPSRTFRNLRLQLVPGPAPEPSEPSGPGTCAGHPHLHTPSLSALKTPLAFAVGEKHNQHQAHMYAPMRTFAAICSR